MILNRDYLTQWYSTAAILTMYLDVSRRDPTDRALRSIGRAITRIQCSEQCLTIRNKTQGGALPKVGNHPSKSGGHRSAFDALIRARNRHFVSVT